MYLDIISSLVILFASAPRTYWIQPPIRGPPTTQERESDHRRIPSSHSPPTYQSVTACAPGDDLWSRSEQLNDFWHPYIAKLIASSSPSLPRRGRKTVGTVSQADGTESGEPWKCDHKSNVARKSPGKVVQWQEDRLNVIAMFHSGFAISFNKGENK